VGGVDGDGHGTRHRQWAATVVGGESTFQQNGMGMIAVVGTASTSNRV
jgi:hypothetical protein